MRQYVLGFDFQQYFQGNTALGAGNTWTVPTDVWITRIYISSNNGSIEINDPTTGWGSIYTGTGNWDTVHVLSGAENVRIAAGAAGVNFAIVGMQKRVGRA